MKKHVYSLIIAMLAVLGCVFVDGVAHTAENNLEYDG